MTSAAWQLDERRVGRSDQCRFSRSSNSTIEPGKDHERKESAQVTSINDTASEAVGDPAKDQDAIDIVDNTVKTKLSALTTLLPLMEIGFEESRAFRP
jgi:hypothetical protein